MKKSKNLIATSILSFIGIIIFFLNLIGPFYFIKIFPFLETDSWLWPRVLIWGFWDIALINPTLLILSIVILILSIISIKKLRKSNLSTSRAFYNLVIGIILFVFPVIRLLMEVYW